jgi:hypothetical protein
VVNEIRVWDDRLRFSFAPLDGHLIEIDGDWSPIDYSASQFETEYDSISDLADDLISEFNEMGIDSAESEDLVLSLAYILHDKADGKSLNLILAFQVGNSIIDFDI